MHFYAFSSGKRKITPYCRSIAIVLLLLTLLPQVYAETVEVPGRCIGVSDGDTVTILVGGRPEKVRLAGIDAPEKVQPFGARAKQYAASIVFGREVLLERNGSDRYGRTVGRVSMGGRSLNEEMVRAGLAWHYRAYSNDARLAALETEARLARRGLWADPAPEPPWAFRRERRTAASPNAVQHQARQTAGDGAAMAAGRLCRGNRESKVFHRPGCRSYDSPNCTVVFGSRAAAVAAGFRPCRSCRP